MEKPDLRSENEAGKKARSMQPVKHLSSSPRSPIQLMQGGIQFAP